MKKQKGLAGRCTEGKYNQLSSSSTNTYVCRITSPDYSGGELIAVSGENIGPIVGVTWSLTGLLILGLSGGEAENRHVNAPPPNVTRNSSFELREFSGGG